MAQAYTAPDWSNGAGISVSNLQSISNVLENIVQGTDKAIHTFEINGQNAVITFVDGTTETIAITGTKGIVEVTKSTSGNVDTYTIIYTDGTTYSFTVTNGGGGGSASEVSYNNTTTQIEATNVQDAIDSVFTSVSNGKGLIASAITDKGIPTLATDTFQTMAEHIAEIEGGGGIVQHEEYYGNAMALYNKTVAVKLKGKFRGVFYSFTNTPIKIKKNGTEAAATFRDVRSSYHHYEYFEFDVEKEDVLEFSVTNTGDNSFCLGWYITNGTSGGGTDVSDTTAIESDVAIGKIFHKADGSRAVGTYEAPKLTSGQVHLSTSASTNIECGFRPKVVNILMGSSYTAVGGVQLDYVETISTAQQWVSGNSYALPTTTNNRIGSINDNGFTLTKVSSASYSYCTWYAIG